MVRKIDMRYAKYLMRKIYSLFCLMMSFLSAAGGKV
ncbi:hypothetical protein PRJBM_01298 [Bartonella henselae]|nr:hypothetical protein Q655_01263 [Bartonella henselae JK 51]CDO40652.1 hypothetical protein PRJBM_01298 [Bartonella henselae]CUH91226.1 hypothetical protein BM1374164_01298 [Bartonella henselae]